MTIPTSPRRSAIWLCSTRARGRTADAASLFGRALEIDEKVHGPGHPIVGTALNNLAGLYTGLHRYADAEPLYRRALAIRERALGPGHPHVASTLDDLAGLYFRQGRYADAERPRLFEPEM